MNPPWIQASMIEPQPIQCQTTRTRGIRIRPSDRPGQPLFFSRTDSSHSCLFSSLSCLLGGVLDPRHAFSVTKRQNKVAKESVLCGSANIGVKGKTIIEAQAVIRGDLSTIELGSNCVVARAVVIRPAEQKFQGKIAYIPMTIGDYVIIEENSIVEAASIGDCTHIGKNCQIGPRCIISPCCEILDNSVLAANSVTPPFSIWSGCPAVQVGKLPESYQIIWQDHVRQFYRNFQPTPATHNNNTATTATPMKSTSSSSATATTSTPRSSATPGHRSIPSTLLSPSPTTTDSTTPMPALPTTPN